jgi:adenylate cyclase
MPQPDLPLSSAIESSAVAKLDSGTDNRALWYEIFANGHPELMAYQRFNRRLPSPPRCKMCYAPFKGLGGAWMKLRGRAPSNRNPRFCSRCDTFIRSFPGGAEVEMSFLFADVRGSTPLAERVTATEFSRAMNRFYETAVAIINETDGFIIDLVGDAVVGLYPPGFSGPDHAKKAIEAAKALIRADIPLGGLEGPIKLGVGVHSGVAFIGTVGTSSEAGIADVRALGDNVNIAARLASIARPGQALISEIAYRAAGTKLPSSEQVAVELKGKSLPVTVCALSA